MITRQLAYALIFALSVTPTGCSVLTKTQVKEVSKFAGAAKDYSEFPGAVIEEHVKIRKTRQVLLASTYYDGNAALEIIQLSLTQQDNLSQKGRQADAALKVLKDYANLLVQLTSDNFTNELQVNCETLGKNIDKGIGQYNELSNSNLGFFGSGIAALVRGIGGIYIRSEQEKALKQAVTSADPILQSMTRIVQEMMALYLDKDQLQNIKDLAVEKGRSELIPGGLLSQEKKDIMEKYKTTVSRYEGKQPPSLPTIVAEEMEASDNAARLAAGAIKAAGSYRQAHSKLAQAILKKQELPDIIEEVQTLVDEVKAAQEIKKKLDKK